tara:strand:- start:41713 stop:41874 length:162 start_codon:yes stop_codon:yes gene_type:complete
MPDSTNAMHYHEEHGNELIKRSGINNNVSEFDIADVVIDSLWLSYAFFGTLIP